jgi:hypothetical protein
MTATHVAYLTHPMMMMMMMMMMTTTTTTTILIHFDFRFPPPC